jgi:glycosylphosphatidylinositol transamidase (GPIT) subunit GPI8
MTEERRCYNCAIDLICQECNEDDSNWQPIAQEKPMEKIQMTEEQAMCLYRMAGDGHVEFIKILKQLGIIRKTALEEAEEMYKKWLNRIGDMSETVVMDKMYFAIQELKSEIARLKG